MDLADPIRTSFIDAGWYQGRHKELSKRFTSHCPVDHPAFGVLSEFGGLYVGDCKAGEECATSDVLFQEIDETFDEVAAWCSLLGTNLIGIAEVCNNHGQLYLDAKGRCFLFDLIGGDFYLEGETFESAMKNLLFGRLPRPLLRPDQSSVLMSGIEYHRGDPRIYDY